MLDLLVCATIAWHLWLTSGLALQSDLQEALFVRSETKYHCTSKGYVFIKLNNMQTSKKAMNYFARDTVRELQCELVQKLLYLDQQ